MACWVDLETVRRDLWARASARLRAHADIRGTKLIARGWPGGMAWFGSEPALGEPVGEAEGRSDGHDG